MARQSDEEVRQLVEHSKESMRRQGTPVDGFGTVDEESEDWIKIARAERLKREREGRQPER